MCVNASSPIEHITVQYVAGKIFAQALSECLL